MSDLGNKEIFAKNLRYYMEIYEKDRNQICQDLSIKYPTFSDWYNGAKYPRIDKIEMLANYFHIKKSDLIENHNGKNKSPVNNIATKLKQIRIDANLTIEQLAKKIKLPQNIIQQYENGETVPNVNFLLDICSLFNISADYLLGLSNNLKLSNNISNNTFVSNNHLSSINIKNEQNLNPQVKELINIFENLDLRNQTKLLSFAFELENKINNLG